MGLLVPQTMLKGVQRIYANPSGTQQSLEEDVKTRYFYLLGKTNDQSV